MSDRQQPVAKTIAGSALLAAVFFAYPGLVHAQSCSELHTGRIGAGIAAYAAGEAAVIAIRSDDWWGDKARSSFNFVTGGSPSEGQDALLHGMIGYHASRLAAAGYRWSCVSPATAAWLGAFTGFALELPKEIGDGLHDGFSIPDMGAALAGSMLPALHETVPVSRALALKFFYWPSQEYRNRPPGGFPQLENDYAGQRYFVSINPGRVTSQWPRWLGFAIGHSVDRWASGPPSREWYVTLDYDLSAFSNGSGAWAKIARLLDQIHFPAPGFRATGGRLEVGLY